MSHTRTGYTRLQIALHWIVAVLVFGAYFTSDGMGRALRARIEQGLTGFEGATLHTILGGLAFLFILIRLVTRWRSGAPASHGPELMQTVQTWGHRLLYALMFLAPALGAATWYGQIGSLGDLHSVVGQALIIIAVGHLVMAMLHQALWSDGTLMRMFQPGRE